MFFEIGLVLLMPVIYLVARRAQVSLITVGIPALAGLSAMHGLVPPHPGPLTAIDYLGADLGVTLALGVLVAVPTVIVAGPAVRPLRRPLGRRPGPAHLRRRTARPTTGRRPSFGITMFSVLLPVALMLGKALADIFIDDEDQPAAPGPRRARHAAGGAADRRRRRDVHARPRRRAWTRPRISKMRGVLAARRSPASC